MSLTATACGIVLLVFLCGQVSDAAQCYTCQGAQEQEVGRQCLEEPWNYTSGSPDSNCTGKCATERQDIITPPEPYFIKRECHNETVPDGCRVKGNMRYCRTSCEEDFCNTDDGHSNITLTTPGPTVPPGALLCYSCSYVYNPGDDNRVCMREPAKSAHVVCKPPRLCYARLYYSQRHKRINSFSRGCLVLATPINKCITDDYGTTCQVYCRGNLCNTGNGVPPPTPKPGDGGVAAATRPSVVVTLLLLYMAQHV